MFFRDLNAASASAGVTTFIWFASGMVPLQIAVAGQLGITEAQASSATFVVWSTAALSSIVLSLRYRQPIPLTWTIPGLIYLGTLGGQFSFAELVGANLVAGFLIVALGWIGMGDRIMSWLPLPIVMGMFAGSILDYVVRMVKATAGDFFIAGSTVAGYLLGRFIGNPRVPPMALAIVGGAAAIFLTGSSAPLSASWAFPTPLMPEMQFSLAAFMAVSLPMVLLSMVLGNVQGLGFLMGQGYAVPVKQVTITVGAASVVNALFCGYPSIVGRTATAILASPDAGPAARRYTASVCASALTFMIAFAASPLISLLSVLPRGYVVVLAGLAILSSLQEALEKAFGERLRFGALVAFAVAATPFTLAGITSAFWAVIAGFGASLLAERSELTAHWRETAQTPLRAGSSVSE